MRGADFGLKSLFELVSVPNTNPHFEIQNPKFLSSPFVIRSAFAGNVGGGAADVDNTLFAVI